MKTTILFLAMMIAATVSYAQSVFCPIDTILLHGSGVSFVDSARIGGIPARCFECPGVTNCASWQLPSDTSLHVMIRTPQDNEIGVQFTTECDFLLWDTCLTVARDTIDPASFPVYNFGIMLLPHSQLHVCADIGDTIIVSIKPVYGHYPRYVEPTIDLNTCSTPTAVHQPIAPKRQYWEFDGVYWRAVDALKPNRAYKVK